MTAGHWVEWKVSLMVAVTVAKKAVCLVVRMVERLVSYLVVK